MERVVFSTSEIAACYEVASKRWENKEKLRKGDPYRISRRRDPVDIWVLGMLGEDAVGRVLGVPMPQRDDVEQQGDGGFADLYLPNGKTVGVRTLRHQEDPWGLYTWDPDKHLDDLGVLVWSVNPHRVAPGFDVVGYFTQEDWTKHNRQHRYASQCPERAVR